MSLFSEVISAQEAQAQANMRPEIMRQQAIQQQIENQRAQQLLQSQMASQAVQRQGLQLDAQRQQFEMQQAARQQEQQAALQKQRQAGLQAYMNVLKQRQGGDTGPGVSLAGGAPESGVLDFDTVSTSILKQNPEITPEAFSAAMEKFAPVFEQQDKMKLAKFKAEMTKQARGPGSAIDQIYAASLRGETPEETRAKQTFIDVKRAGPEEAGQIKAAQESAKLNVSREAGFSKAQAALNGFKQQSELVTKTINDAIKEITPFSTGYGSVLSALPNTQARKLNNYLQTIKSNVGLDKLQTMRDNSPTGGALGPVSDFENKLLQATNGALDPMQSDQLLSNLAQIRDLYPKVLAEKEAAFRHDYRAFMSKEENSQAPQSPSGTQNFPTAVNPQTGETLVLKDGKWQTP